MRAGFLTSLTMVCFAMNSILNRAAVEGGHADPSAFALVRVLAGVLVLGMILSVKGGRLQIFAWRRWGGAFALAVYMIGFSLAYLSLNAGVGALILFGMVQIALFVHAPLTGATPGRWQMIGAGVAFAGLLLALWPDEAVVGSLSGALLMVAAGIGWAGYTVAGRGAADPIAVTTTHFLLALPFLAILLTLPELRMSVLGFALAFVSGGVTSGLGYALWYHVLPDLPGARAAVVQMSVPVIAIALGAVMLGEALAPKVVIAAVLVLGGIALALRPQSAPARHT